MRYHFTQVRMTAIQKSASNKCWRGCGDKGTLLHCWWECKLVQPLWRTVWRFLKKLEIELPSVQFSSVAQSCPTLCNPMDCSLPGSSVHKQESMGFCRQVGCHFTLQGIFWTQGSNLRLLHPLHWQVSSLPLTPPGKPLPSFCSISWLWQKD